MEYFEEDVEITTNLFYGFLVHMSGTEINKPESIIARDENGAVTVKTLFHDKDKTLITYARSKNRVSIAMNKNGYFTITIDLPGMVTAMLVNEKGVGTHGCYAYELEHRCIINPKLNNDTIDFLEAVNIDHAYGVVTRDQSVFNNIKLSIAIAVIDMISKMPDDILDKYYKDDNNLNLISSIIYNFKYSEFDRLQNLVTYRRMTREEIGDIKNFTMKNFENTKL